MLTGFALGAATLNTVTLVSGAKTSTTTIVATVRAPGYTHFFRDQSQLYDQRRDKYNVVWSLYPAGRISPACLDDDLRMLAARHLGPQNMALGGVAGRREIEGELRAGVK